MDDIVCVCRRIYEDDYDTEEELIERLKMDDARCRQCLLRYEDPYDGRQSTTTEDDLPTKR